MNILRERMKKGEKLCGTIVSFTDPALCEVFGNIGYDYIWIDTEHPYTSFKEVLCHLNAARSTGTPAIVRVPQNDLTCTKKILEMDPDGIIFPMVHSAKEAEELIKMTLYPPLGNRGFGPMRAIKYGAVDAKEYTDKISLDLVRFVQIEHIDFINDLEEAVKNPYIDGYIIGPNDLSGSMGLMCDVTNEKVTQAVKKAIKILRDHKKYVGLAVGHAPETIRYWSQFGADMMTTGADWNFVYDKGCENLNNLRKYHLGND